MDTPIAMLLVLISEFLPFGRDVIYGQQFVGLFLKPIPIDDLHIFEMKPVSKKVGDSFRNVSNLIYTSFS
jgi:hypothetical protein